MDWDKLEIEKIVETNFWDNLASANFFETEYSVPIN